MHKNHPHVKESKSILTARHLDNVEKKIAQSVIKADASHSIVCNVINTQNGLCLTKDNIAYLSNKFWCHLMPQVVMEPSKLNDL